MKVLIAHFEWRGRTNSCSDNSKICVNYTHITLYKYIYIWNFKKSVRITYILDTNIALHTALLRCLAQLILWLKYINKHHKLSNTKIVFYVLRSTALLIFLLLPYEETDLRLTFSLLILDTLLFKYETRKYACCSVELGSRD